MDLTLEDKGSLVGAFWRSVNSSTGNLANVGPLVKRIIETGAWSERIHDGDVYRNASFLEFITAKPRKGCGWEPAKVEALIKDDPATLTLWRKATTGRHGGDRTSKSDNITLESKRGTSTAYALARLERERPDLFERVVDGDLSANAAAIEAGFRKKLTPLETLIRAWAKASREERIAFLDEIGAAYDPASH